MKKLQSIIIYLIATVAIETLTFATVACTNTTDTKNISIIAISRKTFTTNDELKFEPWINNHEIISFINQEIKKKYNIDVDQNYYDLTFKIKEQHRKFNIVIITVISKKNSPITGSFTFEASFRTKIFDINCIKINDKITNLNLKVTYGTRFQQLKNNLHLINFINEKIKSESNNETINENDYQIIATSLTGINAMIINDNETALITIKANENNPKIRGEFSFPIQVKLKSKINTLITKTKLDDLYTGQNELSPEMYKIKLLTLLKMKNPNASDLTIHDFDVKNKNKKGARLIGIGEDFAGAIDLQFQTKNFTIIQGWLNENIVINDVITTRKGIFVATDKGFYYQAINTTKFDRIHISITIAKKNNTREIVEIIKFIKLAATNEYIYLTDYEGNIYQFKIDSINYNEIESKNANISKYPLIHLITNDSTKKKVIYAAAKQDENTLYKRKNQNVNEAWSAIKLWDRYDGIVLKDLVITTDEKIVLLCEQENEQTTIKILHSFKSNIDEEIKPAKKITKLAVNGNKVFAGDIEGNIYKIMDNQLQIHKTYEKNSPITNFLVTDDDTIYLTNKNNHVYRIKGEKITLLTGINETIKNLTTDTFGNLYTFTEKHIYISKNN